MLSLEKYQKIWYPVAELQKENILFNKFEKWLKHFQWNMVQVGQSQNDQVSYKFFHVFFL